MIRVIIRLQKIILTVRLTMRVLRKIMGKRRLYLGVLNEALDFLFSNNCSPMRTITLVDIKMPKLSGIEVPKRLKSNPDWRIIPVVALTSCREPRKLPKTYKPGINPDLKKIVKFDILVKAVSEIGIFWLILITHLFKPTVYG